MYISIDNGSLLYNRMMKIDSRGMIHQPLISYVLSKCVAIFTKKGYDL